jgi:hypothetical protein
MIKSFLVSFPIEAVFAIRDVIMASDSEIPLFKAL